MKVNKLYLQSGVIATASRAETLNQDDVCVFLNLSNGHTEFGLSMNINDARKLADAIIKVLEPGALP